MSRGGEGETKKSPYSRAPEISPGHQGLCYWRNFPEACYWPRQGSLVVTQQLWFFQGVSSHMTRVRESLSYFRCSIRTERNHISVCTKVRYGENAEILCSWQKSQRLQVSALVSSSSERSLVVLSLSLCLSPCFSLFPNDFYLIIGSKWNGAFTTDKRTHHWLLQRALGQRRSSVCPLTDPLQAKMPTVALVVCLKKGELESALPVGLVLQVLTYSRPALEGPPWPLRSWPGIMSSTCRTGLLCPQQSL